MLSWEYPPLVVGGLGRHVEGLARELAAGGHDVRVVTRGSPGSPGAEVRDGVRVRRAPADPIAIGFTTESLLAWSQAADHALTRAALPVVRRWRPDIVHAHDWLVAQSGVTLSQITGAALVATIHATESGRHRGRLGTPLSVAIDSVERWLTHRAAGVITCSLTMSDEVRRLFDLPQDKVAVVPNGIDPARWTVPRRARAAARERHAPGDPLVVFAGRLTYEKGLQTLLDCLPGLRRAQPGLRLVVAGTGPHEDELRRQARRLRVVRAVEWAGFVADDELAALLAAADVAVVPSLYEPFGIVALEAAAARTPVVVAEVGGLCDLVGNGLATGSFTPGDPLSLTAAVRKVLDDPEAAQAAAVRAARVIRRDYTWNAMAEHTAESYRRAAGIPSPGDQLGR
jgi:glycogen synthase